MARTIRSIASNVSKAAQKAVLNTSSLFHATFSISSHDAGHIPLLKSRSVPPSISTTTSADNSLSSEDRAVLLRTKQDKAYEEECEERLKDITSLRLMHSGGKYAQQVRYRGMSVIKHNPGHHVVRVQLPARNTVKPQQATFHHIGVPESPIDEQQSGFIGGQAEEMEVEKRRRNGVAVPAYLQRRGAIKHKVGSPAPEPSHGEFDWAWNESDAVGKNGTRYDLERLVNTSA